jgi:hypothetical protein
MAADAIEILEHYIDLPRIDGATWRARRVIQAVSVRRLLTRGRIADEENLLYLLAKRDDVIRVLYFVPAGISHKSIRTAQEYRWSKGTRSVGIPAAQILVCASIEARKLGTSRCRRGASSFGPSFVSQARFGLSGAARPDLCGLAA